MRITDLITHDELMRIQILILGFKGLTSNSKKSTGGRAYADVTTKISDIDRSSFSFFIWDSVTRA